MIISKYLSKKLKFFSTSMVLLVIIVHVYKYDLMKGIPYPDHRLISGTLRILSSDMLRMTVYFLFIISGFLFFKDVDKLTFSQYKNKVSKRIF